MCAQVVFQLTDVEDRMNANVLGKLELVCYMANFLSDTIGAIELSCQLHGLSNAEGSHSVGLHP